MKKFRFRLERVLQYRDIIKKEKRRELLIKNMALQESEEKLTELENSLRENISREANVAHAEELFLRDAFRKKLAADIVSQKLLIIRQEEDLEKAMAEYLEAARDEKSLQMLKTKQTEEYKAYAEQEEFKLIDEAAVQKRLRMRIGK